MVVVGGKEIVQAHLGVGELGTREAVEGGYEDGQSMLQHICIGCPRDIHCHNFHDTFDSETLCQIIL